MTIDNPDTTESLGSVPGPVGPPIPGTDAGPSTMPAGPSTGPSDLMVPPSLNPSTGGTQGMADRPAPLPGPSAGGTGTAHARPALRPRPRSATAGTGTGGRRISGSRLIPGTTVPIPRGRIAWVLGLVSVALTLVIAAPTLLSSQDLFYWAGDRHGLGLNGGWRLLVPVSLDLAAIVCIGMTLVAAWRRERANVFALLVWVFAGVSAYAQYSHGMNAKLSGGAQDAWWAFPALALLGPLLLEVTLHTIRKWARKDAGETVRAFRWLVSPWRSIAAWAYAIREDLSPAEAWMFKRDMRLLKQMKGRPVDAVIHAANALQSLDMYEIRQWLAARQVFVEQSHLDTAVALVPTDLWDSMIEFPAGTGDQGPKPIPVPSASPSTKGTGPSPKSGTGSTGRGNGGGTGNGTVPPVPSGTEGPGTEGPDTVSGTGSIISLADGRELSKFYERHRERLPRVKANLVGWDTMPDRELTTDAIKAAGHFTKQGYACEIRHVLAHERAANVKTN